MVNMKSPVLESLLLQMTSASPGHSPIKDRYELIKLMSFHEQSFIDEGKNEERNNKNVLMAKKD